ncbi:MAG: HAMP domain-containing histidine kinase [Erysipelotrichaceae bacterium]|nr:HAMP domain-containing histidine kinase [Erysipelotrichaceae bacterium]
MKRKSSLRTQILVSLLLFILLVLGLIYVFQTGFLDDFYKKEKISSLISTAEKIEQEILKEEDLEDVIDGYVFSNEVNVRLISNNEDIRELDQRSAGPLRGLDLMTIFQMEKTVEENGGSYLFDNYQYRMGPDSFLDIYIYAKDITYEEDDVLLLVSTMVTPLAATISTIRSQFLMIAVIVILTTVVLALLLSKLFIKPIKDISAGARNLPKGKYENVEARSLELDELNDTLVEANEEILKADKAKKELIGNVSHDLRTPLTMIVGYGEMIRDLPSENNEENINVIIDEARRLSTLVDDLLDVSKSDSGALELHPEDVSINDLLQGVYRQYEKHCEEKNVSFELKLIDDKTFKMDRGRITQVLYNFLNNALNYNDKEEKTIILGEEEHEGKRRIYVYDNGAGIPSDKKDLIWDRYYKVDKEHKRSHIGSGIGLSLAKSLLELHGFDYGVDSKEGEYSKFWFDMGE